MVRPRRRRWSRRERRSGPRGLRPGDGEIAVVVWAVAKLDEMDEVLLGRPVGAVGELPERRAFGLGERRERRERVGHDGAAVVLEPAARIGPGQPGAEPRSRKRTFGERGALAGSVARGLCGDCRDHHAVPSRLDCMRAPSSAVLARSWFRS